MPIPDPHRADLDDRVGGQIGGGQAGDQVAVAVHVDHLAVNRYGLSVRVQIPSSGRERDRLDRAAGEPTSAIGTPPARCAATGPNRSRPWNVLLTVGQPEARLIQHHDSLCRAR